MSTFTDDEITIVSASDPSNKLGFIIRNAQGRVTMLCANASQYQEVSLGDITGTVVVREDASEIVYIGTTSSPNGSGSSIQCSSSTSGKGTLQMNQYSNDTTTPGIAGFKSRSGEIGVDASVVANDGLISVTGIAITGDQSIVPAGTLRCEVQSVPSEEDYVATRWTAYNTALGGPSSRATFQIDSEGFLRIRETAASVGDDFPSSGVVTLAGSGTSTVAHGTLPSNARITLTVQPGQAPSGIMWVSNIATNNSFTISSTTGASDNGVNVYYQIYAPLS